MFPRRIALAILASLLVIASAPYSQLLFAEVSARWPRQSRLLGIGATAVPAAVALAVALVRIRDRRALRYAALGSSAAIAGAYIVTTGLTFGESFHFVEYGLIGVLFYRAWRPMDDGSVLILPLLAGTVAGTVDEWLQWFIPLRAGEARDVGLNGVALGCGILFALAMEPPDRLTIGLRRASRLRVAALTATAIAVFGVFFQSVHLGYEIAAGGIGAFRSRYPPARLAAVRDARAAEWRSNPPIVLRRVSREDQYLSEGMFHVQWRNRMWTEGNIVASWRENLILETYYAPVLDTPSYTSATGHRWPAEQRADAESRATEVEAVQVAGGGQASEYVSNAYPLPMYTWPRTLFWGVHALLAGLVFVVCRRSSS